MIFQIQRKAPCQLQNRDLQYYLSVISDTLKVPDMFANTVYIPPEYIEAPIMYIRYRYVKTETKHYCLFNNQQPYSEFAILSLLHKYQTTILLTNR